MNGEANASPGFNAMKYGLFTCPYQRLPLEGAFMDARAFGYDYIELWGGRPHAFAPDLLAGEMKAVLDLEERYDMPVEVYTPEHNAYPYNYMLGSERQWEDAMDYLKAALRCGKALGAAYTLISLGHSGFAPEAVRKARLRKSLLHLVEHAGHLNHNIVLETLTPYETDHCTHAEELKALLDEIDSDYLFGMCDVVVPFVQGEDPADYPRLLGRHMVHLHLADSDGMSDTHLIPGEGGIDFPKLLCALKACGYDGCATLELVTHYIDTPSKTAREALKRIRRMSDENCMYGR